MKKVWYLLPFILSLACGQDSEEMENYSTSTEQDASTEFPNSWFTSERSTGLDDRLDDCVISLTMNEVQVLNGVVDGFLHMFTGKEVRRIATEPDRSDRNPQDSFECMGKLVLLKNSLYSVLRHVWLAASCQFEEPEHLKQTVDQARKDFGLAMNILRQVDAHWLENSVVEVYNSKVMRLEKVMKKAITVTERACRARRRYSPSVSQVFLALEKSREDLLVKKNVLSTDSEISKNLREQFRRAIAHHQDELQRQRLVVNSLNTTFSKQEEYIKELKGEVTFLKSLSLTQADGKRFLPMLEELLDRYNSSSADDKDGSLEELLEVIQNWLKATYRNGPTNNDPGTSSSVADTLDINYTFQSEDLVLVLTKINAILSARNSSLPRTIVDGWFTFLEEYFNPILVKVASGQWFTLESGNHPGEYLCFQYIYRDPSLLWAVSKTVISDKVLQSKCLWKLSSVAGTDGNAWLYLHNKLNASEPQFRNQDKVKVRLLVPHISLVKSKSNDERADNLSVRNLVVAFISTRPGPHSVYGPTVKTLKEVNKYGREIHYGTEDQLEEGYNQWKLQLRN